jgi:protein-tyrosine phosphatase
MRHLIQEAGLEKQIEVQSAGTAGHHVGEASDQRARKAAKRRGIELSGRARQFKASDFERFDYVLAMDANNFDDLKRLGASKATLDKIFLLRSFDPASPIGAAVPDPYYGGEAGFEEVLDLCFTACSFVLQKIRQEHGI